MFRWYVINTYSGSKEQGAPEPRAQIQSMHMGNKFRRVVMPTDQVIETKDGQKVRTREARSSRLRAREHEPRRRRVDARQEHARVWVHRRQAGASSRSRRVRSTASSIPAPAQPAPAPRSSSRSASRSRSSGPLSDFDGEIVDVNPDHEAQGAGGHLRATGSRRARPSGGEDQCRGHHGQRVLIIKAANPSRRGRALLLRSALRSASAASACRGVLQGLQHADSAGEQRA